MKPNEFTKRNCFSSMGPEQPLTGSGMTIAPVERSLSDARRGLCKAWQLDGSPNLEGRVMFVSSEPGEPTSGFIKMNNVLEQGNSIKEYISMGYIVRTRADIPTAEARSGNTTRRDMALESGAQFCEYGLS